MSMGSEPGGVLSSRNAALTREFLAWQRDQRARKPHTLYTYATILDRFLAFVGEREIEHLPLAKLEGFVQRSRQGRALGAPGAAATVGKEVAMLRTFFRFLVARGLIGRNPAELLVAPTVRNVHPKPIPDDAWGWLWKVADPRERVALGLGFYGGLRRRELTELKSFHVDLAKPLRLVGFVRKGGGDDVTPLERMCEVFERRLPHLWHAEFPELLRALVIERAGRFLLPWADDRPSSPRARRLATLADDQMDPQFFNGMMSRLCARAGTPRYTPHQLRHSTATNLLRVGVPVAFVSRLLNHSSIATTMRYAKIGGDELGQWLNGDNRDGS